ncbi:flippase-like domain-containing protein [bacterium]|nr:flippase-like domain-containing protein [bacterium]
MNIRQFVFVLAGFLVSAVFMGFAFYELQPQIVWETIQQANLLWLLLGAGGYFGAVTLITLRWQFLLRAVQVVPLRHLIPLVCIGYMGNNVYPFRSGEALRIWLLQRNHGVPIFRATTTVIVERAFDGLVMLTFIVVPLALLNVVSPEIRAVASFAAPIFLIALSVFFALAAKPNLFRRIVAQVTRLLPDRAGQVVRSLSEEVIQGLEALRSPKYLAGAVLSSYASWSIEAGVYWIVTWAFDLNISYWEILIVVGTVNLAGLIPTSPGQIGVYEFFVSLSMAALGVPQNQALGYALVVHVVIWLPVTVVGFVFLAAQGLGFGAITRAQSLKTSDQSL